MDVGELGLTSCPTINPDAKKDQSSPPSILDKDLTPITPDSNKETLDLMLQSSFHHMEGDNGPSTPRDCVFDPQQLIMAPHCLKYLQESRSYVARRLKFEFGKCEGVAQTEFDDDLLVETVYDSLLEAIISKQAEDILEEISAPDVLKTPPSASRLTNTCPGAPLKPVRKSRNIDLSLCRKLEF